MTTTFPLVQPVLTIPLPDGIRWDFSAGEGLALLSTELEVPWGYQHLHRALGGGRKWLGAPCPAQPRGIHTSSSCIQSQRALTCPSDHPGCWRRSGAKSWIHPSSSLACQRGRRAESGSDEDTVVSKHTESCRRFSGLIPALVLSSSWGSPSWDKSCWPKDLGFCSSGFLGIRAQERSGAHRTLCQRLP